ncbi:hypothetical protein Tco_0321579 [Tanacetum coccineum]
MFNSESLVDAVLKFAKNIRNGQLQVRLRGYVHMDMSIKKEKSSWLWEKTEEIAYCCFGPVRVYGNSVEGLYNNKDKLNYLEQPFPPAPVAPESQQVAPEIIAAHNAWIKDSKEIAGLMLMTMEPENHEREQPLHANDMLKELKTLFAQQAKQELLQTTRDFHSCTQKRESVSSYF